MAQGVSGSAVDYLRCLADEAVATSDVPDAIAREAAEATLDVVGRGALDAHGRRRASAYFWTVVRRSVVRDISAVNARARFILSAAVADLSESGRTAEGIWDEIERGWGSRVPPVVLEEFRQRLCA